MRDVVILTDEDPVRRFVAAILARAVRDLKLTHKACDAKRFLRSVWARRLFTALDIDHQMVLDELRL